jgi:RNA polymerase sigma-70 factor (ECF subfamily)
LHAVDEAHRPETVDPAANVHTERFPDRLLLDDALDQLSDDLRLAVVLRDVADLDYAEIAEVLDVPVGTVKSRISRGRAALAADLRLDQDRGGTRGNRSDPDERPMDPT